ncbi:MAG TPA: hypothetical protein VFH21_04040 [Burkholderiales bacterium]|nr:hypothetical protein [Burkholderiales bacterium]
MRARRILANVALVVFALAAAFAFGEAVMRLMYKDQTPLSPRYHTDYRYGPYTIRGIRPNAEFRRRNTSDFEYDKPDGAICIISLGDAHTQRYEVRQEFTFSAVLEGYLGEHQRRAEVINAGVSGYSNAEELVFLQNEGVRYQPDVVVVGFSANAFEDNLKRVSST